jgi:hypothetical protein
MERLLSLYLLEDDQQQKLGIKKDVESILGSYAPYLFFSDKPMLHSPTLEECAGEITLGNVIQGEREIRPFSYKLIRHQQNGGYLRLNRLRQNNPNNQHFEATS